MKFKSLRILLATIALILSCHAIAEDAFQGILPVTDPEMSMSLNGTWQLIVQEGIAPSKAVPEADASWRSIPVPGCWEAYGFCPPSYDSALPLTGYYRTTFAIPSQWKGQRIVLRLDGVLYAYDLWLNGKYVGEWHSAYNSALFDLTPFIDKRVKQQQLALRVITQHICSDFDYNDDWAPCGIFRDVTLFAVPNIHIADLTITTKMNGDVEVNTLVAHADKHTIVEHTIEPLGLKAEGPQAHLHVDSPHLWTAETPYLYTLHTRLIRKGKELQHFRHRFGIREVSVDGKILKLNGQPIKLRGVTSHATDPRTVKVIGDSLTLKDMRLMKAASVNYIRTSHYPREPRFYELADSLGFYVIDEVPFGYGDKHLSDTTFYAELHQRAQATIRRDKNHPCVLIWSLGNENPLTDICLRLGHEVKREFDATRPICYPQIGSYFRRFDFKFPGVADIYTPHYPTVGQIDGFYQRSDRPVIFTEYCHTLGISFEDHDRQWQIIERTPWLAGGSVWEWVDQGMPFQNERADAFGYEERVFTSPHGGFMMAGNKGTDGLLYADRTPLPNYYELQHNYARAFITDSILHAYPNTNSVAAIDLNICNRYDFIDLKDNVTFHWTLTADRDTLASGAFSPACPPRKQTTYTLSLPVKPDTARIGLLNIDVSDATGLVFLHQALPIEPQPLLPRLSSVFGHPSADPLALLQEGFLVRAGRKATMAERLKVGDKRLERYLLRLDPDGRHAATIATDIHTSSAAHATYVTFDLTPDSSDTFLSELGLAFLLPPAIDRVRWIGQGPFPSYPGRYRANRYGFWAMRQGDFYFEGNRRGVDAALFTDAEGNGLLLVCGQGDVNFEQTDRGIVVTCNAAVAGQGPKFARTAYPVTASDIGTVHGDFYLYRVEAKAVPQLLQTLFGNAEDVPLPHHPFFTQYDTYLMRFADIVQ